MKTLARAATLALILAVGAAPVLAQPYSAQPLAPMQSAGRLEPAAAPMAPLGGPHFTRPPADHRWPHAYLRYGRRR